MNKVKVHFLCYCLALTLLLSAFCQCSQSSSHKDTSLELNTHASKPLTKPSLLLISIDTLRADHLGCYGYPHPTSPFIDRFSRKAQLFSQAYSHANLTTPSHMSLFTSLVPSAHFVRFKTRVSNKVTLLPEVLKAGGWQNVAFTGGGNVSPDFGFARGFSQYHCQDPLKNAGDTSAIDSKIIPWLKKHRSTPWFLFFHTYRVHDPYTPPRPLGKRFDPNYKGHIINSEEDMKEKGKANYAHWRKRFWSTVNKKSDRDIQHLQALYNGEIYYTDKVLGHFFRLLQQNSLTHNLMIFLLSDHGEEFREHGKLMHNDIYDEVLHVPLLMKGLGAIAAPIQQHNVGLIDVMPTILNYINAPLPPHCRGIPLNQKSERTLSASRLMMNVNKFSIRTQQFKYLKNMNNGKEELFNLKNDPAERVNLALDDSHAIKNHNLKQMRTKAREVLRREETLRKTLGGTKPVQFKDDTLQRLKQLGYILY